MIMILGNDELILAIRAGGVDILLILVVATVLATTYCQQQQQQQQLQDVEQIAK
jgi:hypothetical protein